MERTARPRESLSTWKPSKAGTRLCFNRLRANSSVSLAILGSFFLVFFSMASGSSEAAIHRNRRSCEPGRFIGGEKHGKPCNVVWFSEAVQRDCGEPVALGAFSVGRFEELAYQVGLDDRRADAVRANIFVAVIDRDGFCQQ